ncbi:DNA-binding transcriptional LysR family regulator [Rhodoblastus sphagnicola]|uniref:LysR substrate-binding domain-containing protein n=1 Tax=Rhodoblastus sphagnicola TaxID=333368 RepID=UPI001474A5F4|nr:LysR substrate-binding domain-containing protein [Rhodoblastus sphagnicola]MBB4199622.1 DNA-binding transcriptional LysR family regulator [Rhodoblastus sphagnicola]
MNLDLELLCTFLAVLQHGGFTRAAGRLCKTQSTVSLHIRRLEETVGHALFQRKGREAVLTEHGEMLRAYAEALVSLNNEALLKLRRPVVTGSVRLGILEDFATQVLPIALRRFTDAYPATRLDVRSTLTAELLRELEDGHLDLVVARRQEGSTAGDVLWREPLLWVGARNRRFSSDPLPLVMFPAGCAYRPEVLKRMRASTRSWEIVYTSTSLSGVQAAVAAGVGISVLGQSAVLPEFAVLGPADDLPDLPETEIALFSGPSRGEAMSALAEYLTSAVPSALTGHPR